MKNCTALLVFLCMSFIANAQQPSDKYGQTDQFVIELGPMDSLNIATIAENITKKFDNKENKARAIYTWIANNITLDPKSTRNNDTKNTDPVSVIRNRKTTPLGMANLFQEMSSMANIRCLVVDGFTKMKTDDIGDPPDEINHSWNVVQLGSSPDVWYYVDVSKACGYFDSKQTTFIKKFCAAYFFPNKRTFNLDHFPDNKAWMLGEGPGSIKEFYSLPLIGSGAYELGITQPEPASGYIKTKINNQISFSFKYKQSGSIADVSVVIGEGAKQSKPERMNITDEGGKISFTYKFKKENSSPLKITANGRDLLIYFAEVEEE